MRFRYSIVAAVLAGIVFTGSALAGNTLPDNQYEGRAEGDVNTYVGFDVVKRNGKRKVAKVSALLKYSCQGGGSGNLFARAKGKIKVNDEGRFKGEVELEDVPLRAGALARGVPSDLTYGFKGKLQKRGRAKGRIDANFTFAGAPRGADTRCYSGELDWRAKRGAEVEPQFELKP